MVASIDDTLVQWIAGHRWSPLNDPFVWLGDIERLGAVWIALALVIAIARRLGVTRAVGLAALTALTTFLADSASFAVKDVVHRPRPFTAHPQIHPLYVVHSSSFPAGHAATAFAGATLLSYFTRRGRVALFALATAIAYSRVYVGVHYPSDVIGGAVIGVAIAFGVARAVRWLGERRGREKGRRRGPFLPDVVAGRPGAHV